MEEEVKLDTLRSQNLRELIMSNKESDYVAIYREGYFILYL